MHCGDLVNVAGNLKGKGLISPNQKERGVFVRMIHLMCGNNIENDFIL